LRSGLWQRLTRRTLSLAKSRRGSTTESIASMAAGRDLETRTRGRRGVGSSCEDTVGKFVYLCWRVVPFISSASPLCLFSLFVRISFPFDRLDVSVRPRHSTNTNRRSVSGAMIYGW
jgi:hypothetical protein